MNCGVGVSPAVWFEWHSDSLPRVPAKGSLCALVCRSAVRIAAVIANPTQPAAAGCATQVAFKRIARHFRPDYKRTNPRRMPIDTASVRLAAPSLPRIDAT